MIEEKSLQSGRMTSQYDLVIVNGNVITDAESGNFDIAIENGKIAKVVPRGGLSGVYAKRTIDAQGGLVMVSCSMAICVSC
jgi:dihydropyrimidinase